MSLNTVDLLGRTYTAVHDYYEFVHFAGPWISEILAPRKYPALVDFDARDTEHYLYEEDLRDAYGKLKEILE